MSQGIVEARRAYRKKTQQRQTIVFGTLGGILLVLLAFSLLIWVGVLPSPINKPFSRPAAPPPPVVPCAPAGATAVDPATINLLVYNSTNRGGLASSAAKSFTAEGMNVSNTGNWNDTVEGTAQIISGPEGLPGAYTVARYIPDSTIVFSNDMSGESLTVVLGDNYDGIRTAEQVAQEYPDPTLTSLPECIDTEAATAEAQERIRNK
ncbi:LytR cell envelope-related transcriptional attenuator [Actinobaculum suis]|uniref:LytR C-terminal domain-containing protein n=1 Tax=Actinobaculum suis TaxID=1657 RepID=A0A1G7EFN1_9ACTO|nr:LytR C-terminal domain-containing protein [Actinobaculum suis]MDY5153698.1 LytR C-terminal domain-containing protein [Actinobaculum suis]SDE62417.1 LytR cell envelope-related transcriptional attenuator [Actinobaculum suis]VDG75687.1 Uncharacterised protein [Actinobaculum suis]